MKVLTGRQAPHAAARSREILREMEASQQGTEAEVLVDFFVRLTQQGCTPSGAAQLSNIWHPSKSPPRSLEAQEVQRVCRDLQALHQQWQALAVGTSIIVTWDMSSRQRRVRKLKG
jgi:hypothetical protein